MSDQRLFVVQLVVAVENQWLAEDGSGPPVRCERSYYVESTLFPAGDAEEAYGIALGWLPGFTYTYRDGPGDQVQLSALGIHELEEITPGLDGLGLALEEPYGVDVGRYDPKALDAGGIPVVRNRDDLDVFRLLGPGRGRSKSSEARD